MSEQLVAPRKKRLGLWTAGILSVLGLGMFVYSLYRILGVQQGVYSVSDTGVAATSLLVMLLGLVSLGLIGNGRHSAGAVVLLATILVSPVILVGLYAGIIAVAVLFISLLTLWMVSQVVETKFQLRAIIMAVLAILAALVIEYAWKPAFRLDTQLSNVFIIIALLGGFALLIYGTRLTWRGNIRMKMVTSFMIVALVSVTIISVVLYLNLRNQMLQDMRSTVTNAAALAALQQNGDEMLQISSGDDPLFEKVRVQNLQIRRADPRFAFVYTLGKDADGFYFIVDATELNDENASTFGERYPDASQTLVDNYETMTTAIADKDVYTDQYGTFLSGYAPIFKSDGSRAGVIAVDIAADTILQKQLEQLNLIVLIALIAIVLSGFLGYVISNLLTRPINQLAKATGNYANGDFSVRTTITTQDEMGTLGHAFNDMADQIQALVSGLEQRVAERTQSLELAAEVGRTVSQVRSLDVMLKDAAELIRSQFNLYYVQVYLADPAQNSLVLKSGTGEVGKELISRGHRLPLQSSSINGRAVIEKRSVVVADTESSPTFKPNPMLPETRSEMAVPLVVGEKVVGVLDLQSNEPGALSQNELTAFEALAGQLAIAIQNSEFLAETQRARAEVEAQAQRLTRNRWVEYLDAVHKPESIAFAFDGEQVTALEEGETTPPAENENALVAPISITGETLGNLVVELKDESPISRAEDLVNNVARQVAQQIENLRLLETAERSRAEAEKTSRRMTGEGWKEFMNLSGHDSVGYHYNLTDVKPISMDVEQRTSEDGVSRPIKVREEPIGLLTVQNLATQDSQSLDLINAVAERLGAHIESLRQQVQTKSALEQTEKLSAANLRLAQATDLEDMLRIIHETLVMPAINRIRLGVFNYNAANELEDLVIAASWWDGTGQATSETGQHYSVKMLEALPYLTSPTPLFSSDTFHDERVSGYALKTFETQNIRALALMPLFIAGRQIGVLLLESEAVNNFSASEIRLLTAMSPQVATVLENRLQFERAQKQAERQSTLNVISQKIQAATSVEAVLQIAARELGHALGAPLTIAQLSIKDKK